MGKIFSTKEVGNFPCSCISHAAIFNHLYSPSRKQCNLVLTSNLGGTNIRISPDRHDLHVRTAMPISFVKASRLHPLKQYRVKSQNSEGASSSVSIMVDEQTLERELQIAIEEENYAQAAKIRDNLRLLQEDSKAAVLAANARFYNSFRKGDLAAMQALLSKSENVCVVHPGVSGISGYDLVMGSWEFVWADYEFPLVIEIKDVQVYVKGDLGYVTCTELVKTNGRSWGRQFATNVFERNNGQWFICIHHASYVDL